MFTWLTVLLKKIPDKIPSDFLLEMMRHFAHHQQSCAYNLHSFIVYSCGIHTHTAIEVRFWCDSQKMKVTKRKRPKQWERGERQARRRLNYYGELSSFELALKLLLHRRNIALRSTVLMLMPWNILNWVFTNKLNGDKIRYEKNSKPSYSKQQKINEHWVDIFFCSFGPRKCKENHKSRWFLEFSRQACHGL